MDFTGFEDKFRKGMEEAKIPGASIAVLEHGTILYSKGFGMANREKGLPVTADTLFNTGSVDKVYVAASILTLQQAGKLSIDDPVTNYLTEFMMEDPRYPNITLRMLIDHTSGLPCDLGGVYFRTDRYTDPDFIPNIMDQLTHSRLVCTPGEYKSYCNVGCILSKVIVERVSGLSYGEYLKQIFFEPMGLKNTTLSADPTISEDRFARCYSAAGKLLPQEFCDPSIAGTGGLASTAEDTCRFIEMILNPQAGYLDQTSINLLRKNSIVGGKLEEDYSFGFDWTEFKIPQTQVLSKNGGTTSYSTQVVTAPDMGITITGIASQMDALIYTEMVPLMNEILTAKGFAASRLELSIPKAAEIPDEQKRYAGIYYGRTGLQKIEIEENTVKHFYYNGQWIPGEEYTYREDGTFLFVDQDDTCISCSFQEKDGEVYLYMGLKTTTYTTTYAEAKLIPRKTRNKTWDERSTSLWMPTQITPTDNQVGIIGALALKTDILDGCIVAYNQMIFEITGDHTAESIEGIISGNRGNIRAQNEYIVLAGTKGICSKTIPDLETGTISIPLADGQQASWFHITEEVQITAEYPFAEIRIIAVSGDGTAIYDNMIDNTSPTLPANSYLGLAGAKKTIAQIAVSIR